jgi:hypothetical protein
MTWHRHAMKLAHKQQAIIKQALRLHLASLQKKIIKTNLWPFNQLQGQIKIEFFSQHLCTC